MAGSQDAIIPDPSEAAVRIYLRDGRCALVDPEDAERVSELQWGASNNYAMAWTGDKAVMLHRFILDAPEGVQVDHIDGDGLNNRRSNLRLCSRRQNSKNRRKAYGASRFKGVANNRGYSWRAAIMVDRKRVSLGCFRTEADAAKAYDKAAREFHREFACTNADLGLY